MNAPPEILMAIAMNLAISDVKRLRLVNRQFGGIGGVILKNKGISLLNTRTDINRLQWLLKRTSYLSSCTSLTVFDATWPYCDYKEWENHPRLLGGNAMSPSLRSSSDVMKAFRSYSAFVTEEKNRTHHENIENFSTVLRSLPHLEILRIVRLTPLRLDSCKNYRRLSKKIWMQADNRVATQQVVWILLQSLVGIQSCSNIAIDCDLEPRAFLHQLSHILLPSIRRLKLGRFRVDGKQKTCWEFLSIFPGLQCLSIAFWDWNTVVDITGLRCSRLEELHLDYLRTSEEELHQTTVYQLPRLKKLILGCPNLTTGSLESLVERLQGQCHLQIDNKECILY